MHVPIIGMNKSMSMTSNGAACDDGGGDESGCDENDGASECVVSDAVCDVRAPLLALVTLSRTTAGLAVLLLLLLLLLVAAVLALLITDTAAAPLSTSVTCADTV